MVLDGLQGGRPCSAAVVLAVAVAMGCGGGGNAVGGDGGDQGGGIAVVGALVDSEVIKTVRDCRTTISTHTQRCAVKSLR